MEKVKKSEQMKHKTENTFWFTSLPAQNEF